MTHLDIVRAWKDAEYRASLSPAERALVPAHPAGLVELNDADLDDAAGGYTWTSGVRCQNTFAGPGCYTGGNCPSVSLCSTQANCPLPTHSGPCRTRPYWCA